MDKNLDDTFLNALEAFQDILFRISLSYAKDFDDAKDLFQEMLVNIWKALPSFHGKSTLSIWMYRITLNISLKHPSNLMRGRKIIGQIKGLIREYVASE